jgi:hypothetical protein
VKAAYLFLSLVPLGVSVGVLSFVGCQSSSSAPADGGPPCEPACLEAGPETSSDQNAQDQAVDAGVSCATACAKLTSYHECPYPGCEAECTRQFAACSSELHFVTVESWIECQTAAKSFACEVTEAGVLPVAPECADAAAAVMRECYPDAGPDGGEAGSCGTRLTKTECEQCCVESYTEGYDTYEMALNLCACGCGPCSTPCASTFCSMITPDGGACGACLARTVGPDGGCAAAISNACNADPQCLSYQGCLADQCGSFK